MDNDPHTSRRPFPLFEYAWQGDQLIGRMSDDSAYVVGHIDEFAQLHRARHHYATKAARIYRQPDRMVWP